MKTIIALTVALLAASPAYAVTPAETLGLLAEADIAVVRGSKAAGKYTEDAPAISAWIARGFELFDKTAKGR